EAVTQPGSETAPNARSLAVHLAFDSAWIRAQERTRGERDLLEGEVLSAASSGHEEERQTPVGDSEEGSTLRQWARSFPAAGVRGGAASAATNPGPWARVAGAGQVVSGSIARWLSRRSPAPSPCG